MTNRGMWGAVLIVAAVVGGLWLYMRIPLPAPSATPVAEPVENAGPPGEVLAHLARGVNLSNWLQQGKPDEPLRYAPDTADFARIQALGLKHVRIMVDPDALLGERGLLKHESIDTLRGAIIDANAHDLLVVVAMQLPDALKAALASDPAQREAFAGTWRALATALRDIPTKSLMFEPLNEDGIDDARASRELTRYLVSQLRAVAPGRTLAVAGKRYSAIDDLTALQPLDDPNLVYTFHYYEPFVFTHQAATWGDPLWKFLHDVPYPSSPERVADLMDKAGPQARKALQWHGQQRWDRRKIAADLSRAAAWARAKGVPLWCGEFGVAKLKAPADDRAAWLRDVREALEAQHTAWTHWDYAGPFGIVGGPRGHRVVDIKAIEALGFKPSPADAKAAEPKPAEPKPAQPKPVEPDPGF